ncbi:F0F1 ATP synthase subunit delta [Trueperella pecoris]|uniref:ATP synthase subunit delta n=1 Tax=Trueperella pecoris TaxID=2733571 RepID=A0A7M1QXR9_9ACTO|nr:F0F1 ATP synthase subunit delta [Trueperella pecoris]QOQ39241.1 F0F1 ATP synthase subunit delta [Trueperella pecoris]QOR46125.1 F0F1 ATP synthase subunit delta [Trueperella pecoris]QTG75949.1 F0F1 ATP synthase subunit delta [Trueperella pecoris]
MRSASQGALERARERWEAFVAARPGSEIDLALQMFSVVDTIKVSTALTNALEGGAREADARAALAKKVFEGRVADEVTELVEGLAREEWSQRDDLQRALEALAVDTILLGARREGELSKVEEELYQAMRLYSDNRDLRLAFTTPNITPHARHELSDRLFSRLQPWTVALIRRSIAREHHTIPGLLRRYTDAAARMGDHLVAAVTSAIPLTREQEDRLVTILSAKYGKQVKVHVSIDTSIIGGLRIYVGDDIIEGTIASRLDAVRGAFTN